MEYSLESKLPRVGGKVMPHRLSSLGFFHTLDPNPGVSFLGPTLPIRLLEFIVSWVLDPNHTNTPLKEANTPLGDEGYITRQISR